MEKSFIERIDDLKETNDNLQSDLAAELEITSSWINKYDSMKIIKDRLENEIIDLENTIDIQKLNIHSLEENLSGITQTVKDQKLQLITLKDSENQK